MSRARRLISQRWRGTRQPKNKPSSPAKAGDPVFPAFGMNGCGSTQGNGVLDAPLSRGMTRQNLWRSLYLHVRVADHLAPLRVVGADARREFLGRARDREDHVGRQKPVAEFRLGKNAAGRGAELVDDRPRRA